MNRVPGLSFPGEQNLFPNNSITERDTRRVRGLETGYPVNEKRRWSEKYPGHAALGPRSRTQEAAAAAGRGE